MAGLSKGDVPIRQPEMGAVDHRQVQTVCLLILALREHLIAEAVTAMEAELFPREAKQTLPESENAKALPLSGNVIAVLKKPAEERYNDGLGEAVLDVA